MKRGILFLLLLSAPSLWCQTELLMDKVQELTGLNGDHFLIQGFLSTDRARFLPDRFASLAYDPVDIPMRKGVASLSPATLIPLLLEAGLEADNRVLLVGEEASYCATALSRAGMEVYLIDPTAEASSAYSLKKDETNMNSWISMAPFDFIFCLNPQEEIPPQLTRQLSARGVLLAPLVSKDLFQCWLKVQNDTDGLSLSMLGSASLFPLF